MTPSPSRCCGLPHEAHEVRCSSTGRPLESSPDLAFSLTPAAASPQRALVGRVVRGGYRPTSIIAEGGTSTVYEAEHLRTGRRVALKALHPMFALDPAQVRDFRRGARAAGSIAHPHVCAVYDAGELDDGTPYLVMDRLRGETLADRLERDGRLTLADAAGVARQALYALGAAHAAGVVHGDVKPDNLFLEGPRGGAPFVKLLDFGGARAPHEGPSCADAVAGTPAYMAPEQASGGPLDRRADLYALGVVLYECLTGRPPFVASNYAALLHRVASEAPRSPCALRPSLPAVVGACVCKAIAKAPRDRHQTAGEFLAALAAFDASAEAPVFARA